MAANVSNVLIIADSRGAGLEKPLLKAFKHNLGVNITLRIYKGVKIEAVKRKIDRLRITYELIIVICGICNFTKRDIVNNRKVLTYTEGAEKITHFLSFARKIIKGNCIISTITPASFRKYAEHVNLSGAIPAQEEVQKILLDDLQTVNRGIKQISKEKGAPILNLAKKAFQSSKKKRGKKTKTVIQFKPNRLPDGVHLSDELKKSWVRNITGAINKFFKIQKTRDYCPKRRDTSTSEEDSQVESGNFKRK